MSRKKDVLGDLIDRETKYWRRFFQKEREDAEKIQREYDERKSKKEAEILAEIKRNMPDLHFRACPWCGEEPHIEVDIMDSRKGAFNFIDYDAEFKEYRVDLMCCEHLSYNGMARNLNGYDLPFIPKEPTFVNPKHTWDGSWNGAGIPFEEFPIIYDETKNTEDKRDAKCYRGQSGKYYRYRDLGDWGYAVNKYIEYLADDYPHQCCSCHKKWRGYEGCGNEVEIDGESYCTECAVKMNVLYKKEDGHHRAYDYIIRDGLDVDMMYLQDNCMKYYTSIEACLRSHKLTEADCYTVQVVESGPQGASAMSGGIYGNHWEIWKRNTDPKLTDRSHWNLLGYVFEVREEERAIYERMNMYASVQEERGNRI